MWTFSAFLNDPCRACNFSSLCIYLIRQLIFHIPVVQIREEYYVHTIKKYQGFLRVSFHTSLTINYSVSSTLGPVTYLKIDFGGIYLYFISEGFINIFKELFVCVEVMNIFRAEWEFRDGWIYLLLYDSNHVKTVQPARENVIYRFMWSTRIGHQQGMGFVGVGKKFFE